MPRFKILLDLEGFPIQLWNEREVVRAVSKFGVYLGTVAPEHASDFSSWRVAVATNDLCRIPQNLGMVVGGLEYEVRVCPVAWEMGAIYKAADFPLPAKRYSKPPTTNQAEGGASQTGGVQHNDSEEDDLICCSKRAIQEICRGLDPAEVPADLRALLSGQKAVAEVPIATLSDLVLATKDRVHAMSHCAAPVKAAETSRIVERLEITTPEAAVRDANESHTLTALSCSADPHRGERNACEKFMDKNKTEKTEMGSIPCTVPQGLEGEKGILSPALETAQKSRGPSLA